MERVEVENGLLKVDTSDPSIQHYKHKRSAPTALQKRLKGVTLPVYLPKRYANNKSLVIVSDKNFYNITIPLSRASLMISGDRTFQQKIISGGEKMEKTMKLLDSRFIISEGIMGVDFGRHGVNYSLSVECEQPYKDKRCTKKSFLKRLYNELILVGGSL
jgi:hypothetical protein